MILQIQNNRFGALFSFVSALSLSRVVSPCQPKPVLANCLAIFKATLNTNESVNQQYPLFLLLELQNMTTWFI